MVTHSDRGPLLAVLARGEAIRTQTSEQSEREELFSAALEAAQLGVWQRDLRTDEMVWGGHYEAILTPSPGGFDDTYDGMLRVIHPDDRGRLLDQVEAARQKRAFRVTSSALGARHSALGV